MTQTIQRLQRSQWTGFLKPRERDAHKGSYGHVLIIGGDYGFSGAPRLAGEAALRVGASLVSIATRKEHALVLNVARPELMCHGIETAKELIALLNKVTVIVIGPGLGQSDWAKKCLSTVLKSKKPLVMDADALNLLAKKPRKNNLWILTPHPGEAARLLNQTTDAVQHNRLHALQALQKKYGGVCALKGRGTLILAKEGRPAICKAGNPGMATGGTGDVLSGVIGGLLAQGAALSMAAKLGVLVHGLAGDLAAKEGERGMVASDLLPFLRQVVN